MTNIKKYRQKYNLTQQQFADMFEISIDTVKSWDSGRRQPPKWAKKLIIEKLERGNFDMRNVFSDHYEMACMDIGSNGYPVLNREKYKKIIAKTVIIKFKNGLGKMLWEDEYGLIVASHVGSLDEYYPRIGEIIEREKEQ